MAIQAIQQLKAWFRRGLFPTESQFADWLDSYWHKNEKLPITTIDQLTEKLNSKAGVDVYAILRELQEEIGGIEITGCHCPTFDIEVTEDCGRVTVIRACGEIVSSSECNDNGNNNGYPYGYSYGSCIFIIGDLEL